MPPAGVKACCSLLHDTPPALRAPRRALAGASLERAGELLRQAGLRA
jgi:hypothetical protein